MKKISSLFRAPTLSCASLLFTLHFLLLTYNSNAQWLNKYGQITTNATTGVSKYGAIGGNLVNNQNGKQVSVVIPSVLNPTTNKTWMDRNLGATQAATSSTDAAAYGDLYQWGRGTDGHQIRTSATTSSLSSTDAPVHGLFIIINAEPFDWRSSKTDNLWQGVNGVNNPCPSGYRIPTQTELEEEMLSWSSKNAAGAFASVLKLPMAGSRSGSGSLINVDTRANYWSSTVNGDDAQRLYFYNYDANVSFNYRANGFPVRCIKD